MIRSMIAGLMFSATALWLVGCQREAGAPKAQDVDASTYLLSSEPAGARNVIEARKDAQDKEEVVLVGRIGGEVNPWVADRAAFRIADLSMVSCDDKENDSCPTPWDYCCEVDRTEKTAFVQVVDDEGKLLKHDARKLLNLKELQTVVVQGQAKRDEEGNLTVLARKLYVRK